MMNLQDDTTQHIGLSKEETREFFAPEPLDPALEPFVYTGLSGVTMLGHPFVHTFYSPHLNKQLNKLYAFKLAEVRKAYKEGEWGHWVFLHERPYRARQLSLIMNRISGLEYWSLLRDVWIDTENLWQWGPLKRRLLLAKKPNREGLMNEAEHKIVAGFGPIAPQIYRGYAPPGKPGGWSWTLDVHKAEWFARRFAIERLPHILVGEVKTEDIIAYFESRNEWEIVIDPRKVRVLENVVIGRKKEE